MIVTIASLTACRTYIDDRWFLHPVRDAGQLLPLPHLPAGYVTEERRVSAADSAELYCLLLRTESARSTVLYFGPNMARVSQMAPYVLAAMAAHDVNIVLADYRGYGQSTGDPRSVEQLQADALKVFDAVQSMASLQGQSFVVHGFSLGSLMAAHVAAQRPVAGLVLEASATTGQDWLEHRSKQIPWYLRPFINVELAPSVRDGGNLSLVKQLHVPLLVIVGSEDAATAPAMSQQLYESAATPQSFKRIHIFKGTGHGGVMRNPEFFKVYENFLRITNGAGSTGRLPR